MKKGGDKNSLLFFVFIFGIFLNLIFVDQVFCYDTFITHPGIAGLAVKAYNKNNTQKITAEQYEWIKQGAVDEDTPTRWLNHFYDPVYDRGLWFFTQHESSKSWSQDPEEQQNYSKGDRTWQRAISDYRSGNYEDSFKELGQNIHLVSDALVPAHTRDDIHAPKPDSYEEYVKNNWDNLSKDIQVAPIYKNNLNNIFDEAANYSNNNFYSDDTIEDKSYKINDVYGVNEVATNDGKMFLITSKIDDRLFGLYATDGANWKESNHKILNEDVVLSDYAHHLLPKAVAYSAGTIKLFLDETQKNQTDKLPYLRQNLSGVLNSITAPVTTLIEGIYQNNTTKADTNSATINQTADAAVKQVEIIGKKINPKILPPSGSGPSAPTVVPVAEVPPQIISSDDNNISVPLNPIKNISPVVGGGGGGGSGSVSVVTSSATTTVAISTDTIEITPTSTTSTVEEPKIVLPPPDVVINEIAWAGTSADTKNDEYIELYNNTAEPINLFPTDDISKWWKFKISDREISILQIKNPTIPAHGYYLLETPDDRTVNEIDADIIYSGNLNDSGDDLQLLNNDNQIVDEVDASSSWFAGSNTDYVSMERIDPQVASNSSTNWQSNQGPRLAGKVDGGGDYIPLNGSPKQSNFGSVVLQGTQTETVRTLKNIGYPYILTYYEIPAGKILNIDPGVTIRSNFNDSSINIYGTLNVNGTTGHEVVMTASQDTPTAKSWQGLAFYSGAVGNLSNLKMSYAGADFRPNGALAWSSKVSRALYADGASLNISDSNFSDNGDTAIYLNSSSSTIQNTSLSNGQLAIENYDGTLNIKNISVNNFSKDTGAIYVKNIWPQLSELKFQNNAGNDVMIEQAHISTNSVIGANIPMVWSYVTVDSGAQVDVDPGVTIKLPPHVDIYVKGILNLNGTADNPINILPTQEPSVAADNYWGRIVLDGGRGNWNSANISGGRGVFMRTDGYHGMITVNNGELLLNNCQLLNAIPMSGNDLEINNSKVAITNSTLGYIGTKPALDNIGGIWVGGGRLTLDNATLMNLDFGIYTSGDPFPELHLQNMDTRNFVNVGQYWYPAPWYTEPLL